jgi:hypothetical protein
MRLIKVQFCQQVFVVIEIQMFKLL